MNFITLMLVVGSGSFVGGCLRFLISFVSTKVLLLPIFYATATINIIGSFIIGLLFVIFNEPLNIYPLLKWFLIPGLLGGFTTFSSFSLEFITLINKQQVTLGMLYLLFSLIFAVIGVMLGLKLGYLIK